MDVLLYSWMVMPTWMLCVLCMSSLNLLSCMLADVMQCYNSMVQAHRLLLLLDLPY